jgi:hypothetical protein
MNWKCPSCGHDNAENIDVCEVCGLTKPETVEAVPVQLPVAKLVGIDGVVAGLEFLIASSKVVIGRPVPGVEPDIKINDPYVSRRHAQILFENGKFYIEDLGSTNGTFINDKLITGRTELKDGDTIKLGLAMLKFSLPSA